MNNESTDPAPAKAPEADFTIVESIFVRHRNCLLLRGQFTAVFVGHYLHLRDHGLRYPPALDQTLKDLLAVLTLHLCARPWAETIAWTANLRAPRVNCFATGSSISENITGRVFTEDIREPDRNLLYSQTSVPGEKPRITTVEVGTNDPIDWIEHYYLQSEQRSAHCFRLEDEHYALVVAQPACDEEWIALLDEPALAAIEENEETTLLETRKFRFHCGCTLERILPTLSSWRDRLDELFQGDDRIVINCPRCGATYRVTPDML